MGVDRHRLDYRGDIEGLRALAIILVVAAHAKVSWLAGGFVGVDVFFVLSGYLITGVLLREIEQTGHLQFANFYARRFRRLLPALLLMVLCTCLFTVVALAPREQGGQAVAAATASMWLSNIHFAFAKLDYFSAGAAGNLFLHTWSLGVEEQFYLIWPALILLASGLQRGKLPNTFRLKMAMFAVATASLLCCLILTRTAPQMAFYMMPMRAWQFAVGAVIWLYFGSPRNCASGLPAAKGRDIFARYAGWTGFGLIVAAALWFDTDMAYPGWRSLLPTLGAAAIVAAGVREPHHGISRVLSWRPLQHVGRVSYSWYLWHWPVLLLGGSLAATDSAAYRGVLVILSLLLAIASYWLVELPIRHQSRWVARPRFTVMMAIALMIAANVLCISWFNAAAKWADSPVQKRYARAHGDAPVLYAMPCDDWYHSDKVRFCAFGPGEAKHTVVLMGDSIGAQWFPAVAEAFNRPGWRLLVVTKSSCPMVDEPIFYPRIGRDYVECSTWRENAARQVAALRPDIVILGSVQTTDFNRTQWIEGTARLLKVVSRSSGHVYLLRGTPHLPFNGPNCLSSRNWLPLFHLRRDACQAPAFNKHDSDVYQWLQEASSRFANVTTLDLNDAVCPDGVCHAERGGRVVFRDSQHLTATFAKSLGRELQRRLMPHTTQAGD